ncbi:Glycosyl transferase family 2 [uncultured archaeon]|nr:Glycosyl transferase family 2 [uncultured archaeon]
MENSPDPHGIGKDAPLPVVLVPAYNEEAYIETIARELSNVQKEGAIGHVLFVDDGSTDKTSEIIRRVVEETHMDARVVRFEKRGGKGMPFYYSLRYFFKRLPNMHENQCLVTFDADISGITKGKLQTLTAKIGDKKPTGRKNYRDKEIVYTTDLVTCLLDGYDEYSGQQAYRLKALKPYLINHTLGTRLMRCGMAMEIELNRFFRQKDRRAREDIKFHVAPATGHTGRAGRTDEDLRRLKAEIDKQTALDISRWLAARNLKGGSSYKVALRSVNNQKIRTPPALPKVRRIH